MTEVKKLNFGLCGVLLVLGLMGEVHSYPQTSGVANSGDRILIADYRNSYSSPYGDTYESRFGNARRPYYPYTQPNTNFPLNSKPGASSSTNQNYVPNVPNQYSYPVNNANQSQFGKVNNQNSNWLSVPTNRPPPWTTKTIQNSIPASGKQKMPDASSSTESSQTGPVEISKTGGTIKMEISHSDYLPSLPPSLHKGSQFNGWTNTKIEKSKRRPGLEKFVIPKWLAGRWQRTKTTETKRVKLPEGKPLKTTGTTVAKTVDVFGTYIDGQGKYWQVFNPKRAVGEVDRGSVMDHHRVMKYKIEVLGPKSVVVEVTASHLVVSKKKHQIVKSFQDEELNTYTLLENGKLKTESSVKVFDQLGKPILLTHSVSNVTKIQSAK